MTQGKRQKGASVIQPDTLGNLLCVKVHSASEQDRNAAESVLAKAKEKYAQLKVVFADGGYSGKLEEKVNEIENGT